MDGTEQVQGKRKRKANPHRQLNIADLLSASSDVEEDLDFGEEEQEPPKASLSRKSIKSTEKIDKIDTENDSENGAAVASATAVDEIDNFDSLAEILGIKEIKPELFGGFSMAYGAEVPISPASSSSAPKRRTIFSVHQETHQIFKFLLDQIRSQSEGREGRVAKRKVETSSIEIWEKYKKSVDGHKDANAYRVIYRTHCQRLFDLPSLSLSEKVDLFYALDIKVPKNIRQKLIDTFHVEIADDGIISGQKLRNHWDLIHPDSDREDEDDEGKGNPQKGRGWNRFTERDDGLMWEYVLEHVQNHASPFQSVKKAWETFRSNYKNRGALQKRNGQTYSQRFVRILAPNLHKMPFDIETKAAIYENTGILVPEEFRDALIAETGVKISEEGIVTEYKNRPKKLVLQSKPIDNVIGITSANRISTLGHPKNLDSTPFTDEEDHQIWDYILSKFRTEPGKPFRAKKRLCGWSFWREFVKDTGSKRTWQSLCQHFNEDLQDQVMATDYELNTKIELLFILNVPIGEEDKKIIEQTTDLVLNEQGGISFAAGRGFRIGKVRDSSPSRPISRENSEELTMNLVEMLNSTVGAAPDSNESDPIPKILEKLAKLDSLKSANGSADFSFEDNLEDFDLEGQSPRKLSRQGRQRKVDKNTALNNDNLRDFMNKIALAPPSQKEGNISLWKSTSQGKEKPGRADFEDYEQFEEPAKKRGRPSLRHCPENAETCKKVEEILKNFTGGVNLPEIPQNDEDYEEYPEPEETIICRPIRLEDLAENAAKLLEDCVKMEPMDDYEHHFENGFEEKKGYGQRNGNGNGKSRKTWLSGLIKQERPTKRQNDGQGTSSSSSQPTRIESAFSKFEEEIQKFADILEVEGKMLSGEEKLTYLERIETVSKNFRITAKDALTRF